jgi:hypothetical protein
MRLIIGVLACASMSAASVFAEPPAPSAQVSQDSASAPTQAPAETPTAAAAAAAKSEVDADEKALVSRGYRPEMLHGQKVFCRREPKLGTKFEEKRCGSVAQLAQEARNARDMTEKSQRNQTSMPGH